MLGLKYSYLKTGGFNEKKMIFEVWSALKCRTLCQVWTFYKNKASGDQILC